MNNRIESWIEQQNWLDWLDRGVDEPHCDKTLLCDATTHKRSCFARTVNVAYYVRKIGA